MKKREPSHTTDGCWCNQYRKQYEVSLKKLKIELPYDPETPHLGTYPEKKKHNLKRYKHLYVHSSTIHNSQGMEIT